MMEKEIKSEIIEWIKTIALALVLAIAVRTFIFEPMIVPTGSMIHTIEIDDKIFVNKYIYRFQSPKPGDIVVFTAPDDPSQTFVKRLIGVGGDVIEIHDGVLFINDKPVEEPYIKEPMIGDFGPYKVPDGHYFMMGDNRNNSRDSRVWNNKYVPRDKIIGKATYCIWPINRFGPLK
jgi:signal peptidase I